MPPPKSIIQIIAPYLIPAIAFFAGVYVNYVKDTAQTSADVKQLTVAVNKLSDKMDEHADKDEQLGNRVTALGDTAKPTVKTDRKPNYRTKGER
jgi:hypothetical protein